MSKKKSTFRLKTTFTVDCDDYNYKLEATLTSTWDTSEWKLVAVVDGRTLRETLRSTEPKKVATARIRQFTNGCFKKGLVRFKDIDKWSEV